MLPSLTLSSYRVASGSDRPNATKLREIVPTVALKTTPLKEATTGPAAMKGPTPGMASGPISATQPNTPPTLEASATAPGPLVFLSCTEFRVSYVFGNRTETCLLEKLSVFK